MRTLLAATLLGLAAIALAGHASAASTTFSASTVPGVFAESAPPATMNVSVTFSNVDPTGQAPFQVNITTPLDAPLPTTEPTPPPSVGTWVVAGYFPPRNIVFSSAQAPAGGSTVALPVPMQLAACASHEESLVWGLKYTANAVGASLAPVTGSASATCDGIKPTLVAGSASAPTQIQTSTHTMHLAVASHDDHPGRTDAVISFADSSTRRVAMTSSTSGGQTTSTLDFNAPVSAADLGAGSVGFEIHDAVDNVQVVPATAFNYVDDVAPTATITVPPLKASTDVGIALADSDDTGVVSRALTYTLNGGAPQTLAIATNNTWAAIPSFHDAADVVVLHYVVTDAGPTSTARDATLSFSDDAFPVSTLSITPKAPTSGWYTTAPTVGLTATSASASGSYVIHASIAHAGTTTTADGTAGAALPLALSGEGTFDITYWTDGVTQHETPRTASVKIETSAPTGPALPTGGKTTAQHVPIAFSATSGIATSGFTVNGAPVTTTAWDSPQDGNYQLAWSATSVAGRTSSATSALRVDTTPPTITLTPSQSAASNGHYFGPTDVTVTASDALGTATLTTLQVGGADATSPLHLGVGTHTIHVAAADDLGNAYAAPDSTVIVDPAPLTIAARSPFDAGHARQPILDLSTVSDTSSLATLTATYVGSDGATHVANAARDGAGPWQLPAAFSLADGAYTLRLAATDVYGQSAGPVDVLTFTLDQAVRAPSITTDPAAAVGLCASSVSVSWTLTAPTGGTATAQVSVDGGAWGGATSPYALLKSDAGEGAHTVLVRALDDLGRTSVPSSAAILFDCSAPDVQNAPGALVYGGAGYEITLQPTASVSAARVVGTLDGGVYATIVAFPISGEGEHTLRYHAIDAAGNVGPDHTTRVIISTTPPTLTIPAQSFTTPDGKLAVWIGTAPLPVVRVDAYLVAPDGSHLGLPATADGATFHGLAPGAYVAHARAVDLAGNVGPDANATLTIDERLPGLQFAHVPAWTNGSFDAEIAVDDATQVAAMRVQITDMATNATTTLTLAAPPYTFHVPETQGDVSIAATATDLFGTPVELGPTVTQVDRVAPRIVIDGPLDGAAYVVGSAPTLSASAIDDRDAAPTLSYHSCLADACVERAPSFVDVGVYDVTITATDSVGNRAATSLRVTITAPPAPPATPPTPPTQATPPAPTLTHAVDVTGATAIAGGISVHGAGIARVEYSINGARLLVAKNGGIGAAALPPGNDTVKLRITWTDGTVTTKDVSVARPVVEEQPIERTALPPAPSTGVPAASTPSLLVAAIPLAILVAVLGAASTVILVRARRKP